MTSTLFQRFGGLELPAEAQDVSETLSPLDPGRDILLGLFEQALTSELSPAWDVVKIGTALQFKDIVESTLPMRPSPRVVQSIKLEFPALFVYRDGPGTFEEHTLSNERLTQSWGVDYVLGPLPPEDERRLGDVLTAAAKVIALTVKRRGHPDYDSGALQFFASKGHFGACRVVSYETGQAQFAGADDSPTYLALSVKLETVEYEGWLDGASAPFEGFGLNIGIGDEGGVLPDVVRVDTDAIPDDA